ncbi:hypothetical protein TNCV_3496381 [Trichonephila clavipes]|nr:hypothetical protein TNCV_3496381 [Trichonephila clavipes]
MSPRKSNTPAKESASQYPAVRIPNFGPANPNMGQLYKQRHLVEIYKNSKECTVREEKEAIFKNPPK